MANATLLVISSNDFIIINFKSILIVIFKSTFLLHFCSVLSKDFLKPSITIGTTIGFCSFIICAVPFLTGAHSVVVPCGNVISHPFFSALFIFSKSLFFTALFFIFFPLLLQVLILELLLCKKVF